MKILHCVESYDPDLNGMQHVAKNISERLAKSGHDVTVATGFRNRDWKELNGVKVEEFKIIESAPLTASGNKNEIERYKKLVLEGNWDVVTFFAAQIWTVDLLIDNLDQIKAKKVFVPTGFSGLTLPEYQEYFNKMKNWLKQFDMNVFLSNDYKDINFAKENNVKNIMVIPNGANEEELMEKSPIDIRKKVGIKESDFLIYLVGGHTLMKGHKEAIKIFSKAKIKNAVLWIMGNYNGEKLWRRSLKGYIRSFIKLLLMRDPFNCLESCLIRSIIFNISPMRLFDKKKILVKYVSREETIAGFQNADMFLYPSNIECSPIVLFEATAAGLPSLVSDAGNMKEILDWTKSGYVLPTTINNKGWSFVDIEKSARMLEEMYNDKEGRKKLGENGRKAWLEKFTWKKIARKYEELYKKLNK